MTIKEELKLKHDIFLSQPTEEDQKLYLDAVKIIEETIIPKFRYLFNRHPLLNKIEIYFFYSIFNSGCFFIDESGDHYETDVPYYCSIDVVRKAVEIAHYYDITAFYEEQYKTAHFFIDLS